jgi:glycosyltransferase involved in cell wall biosynthesis
VVSLSLKKSKQNHRGTSEVAGNRYILYSKPYSTVMDTPLVSIILSTYNGSRYICEAIDSVLAQDFIDFEFLIIDDASTDNTANILYTYGANDTRIRIFRNAENLKLVGSLNYGLQEARGKYIARIDDDDIWQDSTKLTRQVQELEKNTDIAVV